MPVSLYDNFVGRPILGEPTAPGFLNFGPFEIDDIVDGLRLIYDGPPQSIDFGLILSAMPVNNDTSFFDTSGSTKQLVVSVGAPVIQLPMRGDIFIPIRRIISDKRFLVARWRPQIAAAVGSAWVDSSR